MLAMARGYQNEVVQVIFEGPKGKRVAQAVGVFDLLETKYTVKLPQPQRGEKILTHTHPSNLDGTPRLRFSKADEATVRKIKAPVRVISRNLSTGTIEDSTLYP